MPQDRLEDQFTPGSREWYEARLYGLPTGEPNAGRAAANRNAFATEAAYFAPGTGEVLSARDAWDASGRGAEALRQGRYGEAVGNYGDMLTGMLGAVPGAGIVARGTRRGAEWMNRNVPRAANTFLDRVTPADPKNTVNIFAGPGAATADRQALAKAREMTEAGASRDDIWRDTGWFQGSDGKWRFEIDDSASQFSALGVGGDPFRRARTMDEALDHPELFHAYPYMGGFTLGRDAPPGGGYFDAYYPGGSRVSVGQSTGNAERSVALHEMQHGVQADEGFARGGSRNEFLGSPETLRDAATRYEMMKMRGADLSHEDMWANARSEAARDHYRRLAGEVEARNVQIRRDMTQAERRAAPPWRTQDTPDNRQILRYSR